MTDFYAVFSIIMGIVFAWFALAFFWKRIAGPRGTFSQPLYLPLLLVVMIANRSEVTDQA